MKKKTVIWTIILLIAGGYLLQRAAFTEQGMGKGYTELTPHQFVQIENPSNTDSLKEKEKWVERDSVEPTQTKEGKQISAMPGTTPIEWINTKSANPNEINARNKWLDKKQKLTARLIAQRTADGLPVDSEAIATTPEMKQLNERERGFVVFSYSRTIGIWIAAFFTLAIMSFLYKDNPFYKVAEAILVGVSAAYWMVLGFWTIIVPNLFANLNPAMTADWAMPGLRSGGELEAPDWWYLVPLILGIMLIWRLSPKGAWIARWPVAFTIGAFCGMRLPKYLDADFVKQISETIKPLYQPIYDNVTDPATGNMVEQLNAWSTVWASLPNIVIVVGVLSCLVYFFFSLEHKGIVGKTAKVGIWYLMIAFGAAFGYTVMGRIALLAIRFEFLFDDWLWFIDPIGKRTPEEVSMIINQVASVIT